MKEPKGENGLINIPAYLYTVLYIYFCYSFFFSLSRYFFATSVYNVHPENFKYPTLERIHFCPHITVSAAMCPNSGFHDTGNISMTDHRRQFVLSSHRVARNLKINVCRFGNGTFLSNKQAHVTCS